MLSILLLSQKGEGYGLAQKLASKGHIAKFWVADPNIKNFPIDFKGKAVHRYDQHIEASDVVIQCAPGFGAELEAVRERGKMVLGGGVQDLLVTDLALQNQLATMLNVPYTPGLPPTLTLAGWFNGTDWLAFFLGQRYTRLLDRERGPLTPGMGILMSKVNESLLSNITSFLASVNYRGLITLNLTTVEQQIVLTDINPFWDELVLATSLELMRTEIGQLLYRLAVGEGQIPFIDKMWALGARVVYDPGSYSPLDINPKAAKHVWPELGESLLGIVTARGIDPYEARRRVYRTVYSSTAIEHIYRTDLGINSIWESINADNDEDEAGAAKAPRQVQEGSAQDVELEPIIESEEGLEASLQAG